MGVERRR